MSKKVLSKLKGLRAEYGKTQKDMAAILGISERAYWEKENGNSEFTVSEGQKIADLFSKTQKEIFFAQNVDERTQTIEICGQ